jgi:hypothetical protein
LGGIRSFVNCWTTDAVHITTAELTIGLAAAGAVSDDDDDDDSMLAIVVDMVCRNCQVCTKYNEKK